MTDLHHDKEGSSGGMEEIACCGAWTSRLPSREIREKFQVHMPLTEETSSVGEVQRLLKQQSGFEVIFLDAKHLPLMGGETTNGKFL